MGKLTFENGKFYFEAPPYISAKESVEIERAGFIWCADTLRWVTRNPRKAVTLRRFADESAEQKFKKYFITDFEPPEQIIYPDHLTPKSFQIESAWHCVTRSPAYCADEAGLGKTIVAALCMNSVPGRALIICPAGLKYNWADEIIKWSTLTDQFSLCTIKNGDEIPLGQIVILPDSLLTNPKMKATIGRQKFTWLFVDEAHRYKEATAQRTQALVGTEETKDWDYIANQAERVVLLSGTPIPNGRPKELYPVLSRIAPEAIGHRTFLDYGKTFCDGKQVVRHEGSRAIVNWNFDGASNLKQLRRELRAKLMIRHLKKDVLKELGPKTRKIIFLDEVERLKAFEKKVLKNFTLEQLMGKGHTKGDIATYRRQVGEAKITPAFIYINDLLENSPDKLVVFAHHISVVEGLHRMLKSYHPLMIRGGMNSRVKQEYVHQFQTNKKHRVIIGNIEAMGVGNTLTAAPGVIMVEYDWRPGINQQAEDRIHRLTQKNKNMYFRYLALRNSLDERMLLKALEKDKAIKSVLG